MQTVLLPITLKTVPLNKEGQKKLNLLKRNSAKHLLLKKSRRKKNCRAPAFKIGTNKNFTYSFKDVKGLVASALPKLLM